MNQYTTKIIIPLLDETIEVSATNETLFRSIEDAFAMKKIALDENKKE